MPNFWRMRVPFYFVHETETIHITHRCSYTHEVWANRLGLTAQQRISSVRGFYWPPTNELFFYWGEGTDQYLLALRDMQEIITKLLEKIRGNERTLIYGGAVIDPDTPVVTGIHCYGNWRQLKRAENTLDDYSKAV